MNMIFYSLSLCRDIFHCHKNHYSYSSKVDVFTVGHWAGATRATYPQGSNNQQTVLNDTCDSFGSDTVSDDLHICHDCTCRM